MKSIDEIKKIHEFNESELRTINQIIEEDLNIELFLSICSENNFSINLNNLKYALKSNLLEDEIRKIIKMDKLDEITYTTPEVHIYAEEHSVDRSYWIDIMFKNNMYDGCMLKLVINAKVNNVDVEMFLKIIRDNKYDWAKSDYLLAAIKENLDYENLIKIVNENDYNSNEMYQVKMIMYRNNDLDVFLDLCIKNNLKYELMEEVRWAMEDDTEPDDIQKIINITKDNGFDYDQMNILVEAFNDEIDLDELVTRYRNAGFDNLEDMEEMQSILEEMKEEIDENE